MKLRTSVDAVTIFDPEFASDHGVGLVRSVLDQARCEPRLGHVSVEPTAAERRRLDERHRLGPLVGRRFPCPESVERERDLMNAQLHLSVVARQACSAMSKDGIESRVLKGLATSELDYRRPSLRHTGDVDLLVARDHLQRAVDILIGIGLIPADEVAAAEGRLTDGHNLKGAVFEHPSGVEVDLHYRLSRFGPPSTDLMTDSTDLLFGLSALSVEYRLLHAAAHAVLTPNPGRRLSSVADIVALLDNTVAGSTEFSWARMRGAADELGLTAAVGVGLRAEALLMDRTPHPGLEWPRPGVLMRSMTETTKRRPLVEHALTMAALPPDTTRRSYLQHRLTPSSRLAEHRGGRAAYYRGLLRKSRPR